MKGTVKNVRKDKTACQIEDKWYYFKQGALEKMIGGDQIYGHEISYVLEQGSEDRIIFYEKGDKKIFPKQEIEKRINTSRKEQVVDWDGKERRIIRQNALSQANALLNTMKESITSDKIESMLFEIAEKCEAWVFRDQAQQEEAVNSVQSNLKPNPPASVEEGGLAPLSSPLQEREHEDWITYKVLKGDQYKVKALWVDYAKTLGYNDKDLLRIWDEKNVGSN